MHAPVETLPELCDAPQNGLAGLKHWRYDLQAGLLLAPVALVYGMGISDMSGFPLVAGVWSAIIAGIVFPIIRGSYLTISGPGVGLAPLMMWTVLGLGFGDVHLGYERALVVVVLTGCIQAVLSYFKVASLGKLFPSGVIHGMLGAIGIIALVKQFPKFFGVKFEASHPHEYLLGLPSALTQMAVPVVIVSATCLAVLLMLDFLKKNWAKTDSTASVTKPVKWWLRTVPPQATVVVVGVGMGLLVGMPAEHLTHIPSNPLDGFALPDFTGLIAHPELWSTLALAVLLLVLIDGVESVATALGIDGIDPWKRTSNPNRVLLAMGVTNIIGGFIGCLPAIPGGMKSRFNTELGGRTLWANAFTASFLLIILFAAGGVIALIPLGVLAAVLMHVGGKLTLQMLRTLPKEDAEGIGLFAITLITTLATDDLVYGIAAGLVAALVCAAVRRFMLVEEEVAAEIASSPEAGLVPLTENEAT